MIQLTAVMRDEYVETVNLAGEVVHGTPGFWCDAVSLMQSAKSTTGCPCALGVVVNMCMFMLWSEHYANGSVVLHVDRFIMECIRLQGHES